MCSRSRCFIYGYDDNGNTVSETLDGDATTYVYNGKNQLVQTTKTGITSTYTYNPNGIRNGKTEGGVTTRFIVDENRDYAQVLEEITNGTITTTYSYGHDLISQERNGSTSFYHYDGLGSTRALSDAGGSLTDTYDYEAFGELLNQTGSTENSYLFTGEQFDSGLNQYYLRARYYNQAIGRFTQMDTWMGNNHDPITLHKYAYGNADPVTYVDPTGNFGLGSFGVSFNIMGRVAIASLNAYSNISFIIDLARGDLTLTELALTYTAKRFLPRALFKCKNSFSAGTLVHSEKGLVPIENVSIGDKVWAYNEGTGERSLQEVIHRIQGVGAKELVDITLNSGEVITATADHPLYIFDADTWLDAGKITSHHYLYSIFDEPIGVESADAYEAVEVVYNFSVANDHTYYVGSDGVLAHNCYQKPKSIDYRKHVAPKNLSRQEVVESTKNGNAKYFLKSSQEVQRFELDAWKNGLPTTNGKPWKVVEFPEEIGAYNGKSVRWLRLEYSEGGDVIHGHPISLDQYRNLLK